jgi:hypothetical protein
MRRVRGVVRPAVLPGSPRPLSYTSTDPLRGWIRQHRFRYAAIRNHFYEELRRSYMSTRPFPEIRHFT